MITIDTDNEEVRWILGRPCFTFIELTQILRAGGQQIKRKAEDEQCAGIIWMLQQHQEHGENWREEGGKKLKAIQESLKK